MSEEYYDSKRISNSHLSWLQISPKYYQLKLAKEIEEEPNKSFDLGTQTHMYFLEPDRFNEKYTFFDFQKPLNKQQEAFCEKFVEEDDYIEAYKFAYSLKGKSEEKIEKEAKKLLAILGHYISYLRTTNEGRIVLPNSRQDFLEEAKSAVKGHILANALLFPGQQVELDPDIEIRNEFRIDWIDPITKLECKSLIDRLVINHTTKTITLIDLKTTSNMKEFRDKFKEYNYDRQLAYYWSAIHYYLKQQDYNWEDLEGYKRLTYIIAVSTVNPIEVRIYPIGEHSLLEGLNKYQPILEDLKWHIENNKWEHTRSYYTKDGLEWEL